MQQTIILVESHEPEMQVTLPVGTHVLELVVQDSGGEESPPVTIVVIVEPDTGKEPIIDDFAPKWLGLGQQADPFVIKGWRLSQEKTDQEPGQKTTVEFTYADNDKVDPNITAKVKPESTAERLELVVEIGKDGKAGDRRLRVNQPSGVGLAPTMFQVKRL